MALNLITPPAVEPVFLEELKEFLRVDAGDVSQDNTIMGLAMAGRSAGEVFTKRRFVNQTWRLLMDFFPGYIDMKLAGSKVSSPFVSGSSAVLVGIRYAIALPYPPVRSIASFQFLNANGTLTTMNPATDYVQDLASNPARLSPPFGQMWPVARVVMNAVQVDYPAGYASPVTLSIAASSKTVTGHVFAATDAGRPISIPGAGPSGVTLNTIVASVDGAGAGTVRDQATTAVTSVTAILVDNPNANPGHWELIRLAIKNYVYSRFERRMPERRINDAFEETLYPVRDLRF